MDPESLLVWARDGDRQAWNDLLAWCRPFIRALLRRQLRNPEDASELTNDVQVRMDRGFPQFCGVARGQFIAWALRITSRVLYDHIGRPPRPGGSLTVDPPCPQVDVSGRLTAAEDMVRLAKALEGLRTDYRTVIEARLFEGLSPKEIAQRLGWPAGRVRVFSLRAVKELSARLRGES
jgi:RNA polymerase sigma factor (sigma-70 family)